MIDILADEVKDPLNETIQLASYKNAPKRVRKMFDCMSELLEKNNITITCAFRNEGKWCYTIESVADKILVIVENVTKKILIVSDGVFRYVEYYNKAFEREMLDIINNNYGPNGTSVTNDFTHFIKSANEFAATLCTINDRCVELRNYIYDCKSAFAYPAIPFRVVYVYGLLKYMLPDVEFHFDMNCRNDMLLKAKNEYPDAENLFCYYFYGNHKRVNKAIRVKVIEANDALGAISIHGGYANLGLYIELEKLDLPIGPKNQCKQMIGRYNISENSIPYLINDFFKYDINRAAPQCSCNWEYVN